MSNATAPAIESPDVKVAKPSMGKRLLRNPSVLIGGAILLLIALMGLASPWLSAMDPADINPSNRNKLPGFETTVRDDDGNKITQIARMGTDSLGRDIYTRVVWGARVSLTVGITVATLSVAIGLAIGLVAGYFRALDGVVMRVMDGLMAVPAILVAIALVSLSGASLLTVIVAVTIPEIPRVVRLVRAIVLSIREEPYVEAAISVGTPTIKVLWRHVLPNTIAPLDRAGHLHRRLGHPAGSGAVLPGRGHPARDPHLGQHHGRGPQRVPDPAAQHPLSGGLSDADGAGGQHARRRLARHAGPAHGQEGLT